jgi:hypothetical protein
LSILAAHRWHAVYWKLLKAMGRWHATAKVRQQKEHEPPKYRAASKPVLLGFCSPLSQYGVL